MRSFNRSRVSFFLVGCLLISVSHNFYIQQDSLIENKARCEVFALVDHTIDQITKPGIDVQVQTHRAVLFPVWHTSDFFLKVFSRLKMVVLEDFLITKRNFYNQSIFIQLCVVRI